MNYMFFFSYYRRLCVEKAVSVLCSDLYINIFSTHSDTLSCTIVPLMFVSHHGTTHSRNILNTVSSSLLIKKHRALKNLCELIQSDGKLVSILCTQITENLLSIHF